MKINLSAFGAPGEEASAKQAHQAVTFKPHAGTSADAEKIVADTQLPQVTQENTNTEEAQHEPPSAPRSLFTRPAGNSAAEPGATDAPSSPVDEKSEAKRSTGLKWTWPRRSASSPKERVSAAIEPNKSRPLLIVAGVFVIGAVVGPWLAQRSAPPQQQAGGPNSAVQAVADTLNGGAFASSPAPTVATPGAGMSPTTEVSLGSVATPQVEIPAAGEERYAAMLERMKKGEAAPQEPLTIIPEMKGTAKQASPAKLEIAKPVDPYPKVAIPLQIEKTAEQSKTQSDLIQIERGITPSGKYVVLRIERNPEGLLAALLMPVGGRQAIDSAWVFVGDATSDGMVVENINANSVVMRTVSGRSVQIALN
ncbi:hypothetical protein MCEMSEM18_03468 [Comamonadaceae bacterium]